MTLLILLDRCFSLTRTTHRSSPCRVDLMVVVTRVLLFSLGRLTSEASTVELMGLLTDDNPDMLATTAIALAKHDVDESVPYLVGAVLSPQVQFWLRSKAGIHLEHLVDQDFSFTTGYGFKRTGRAVTGDELEPALAEIHYWWQKNKDKYQ